MARRGQLAAAFRMLFNTEKRVFSIGVPTLSDKMTMLLYGEKGIIEKEKLRKKWEFFEKRYFEEYTKEKVASEHQDQPNMGMETLSKLLLIQGALDWLLKGGGKMYSAGDKPLPEAITEVWKGMTGLDAKKQKADVKEILETVTGYATDLKILNEMVRAILTKMNIPIPVSSQVASASSPPPPPPDSNGEGGNGGGASAGSPPPPPPSPVCNDGGDNGGGDNGGGD